MIIEQPESNIKPTTTGGTTTPIGCYLCHEADVTTIEKKTDVGVIPLCEPCINTAETCYNCKTLITNHPNGTVSGFWLCDDCVKNFTRCDDCGNYIINDGDIHRDNHITVCNSCVESHAYCDHCNRYYDEDNTVRCDNCCNSVCGRCSITCDNCDLILCNGCIFDHNCSGDEFEETSVNTDKKYGTPKLAKLLKINKCVAVEIECEGGQTSDIKLPVDCGIGRDGSLDESGVELQTPPRSCELAELIISRACNTLTNAGYSVSSRCGTHIHIDCTDIQNITEKLEQLYKTYYCIEPILYSLLPKRRKNNRYCIPLSNDFGFFEFTKCIDNQELQSKWYKCELESVDGQKSNKYHSSRYHGFNMHSIFFRGSLELRYHTGTLETSKIINWLYINLKVVEWATRHFKQSDILDIANYSPRKKITKFCEIFKISKAVEMYMVKRFNKFKTEEL